MLKLNHVSDSASDVFYQMITSNDLEKPSLETPEEYTLAESKFIELSKAGNWRGLNEFIELRTSNELYLTALKELDSFIEKLEEKSAKLAEPNRRSKLVNKDVAFAAGKKLRTLTLDYRALHEDYAFLLAKVTEYRVLTARAAQSASILREEFEKANGTFVSYDEDTLGDLIAMGEYTINSPEWHAARAEGIGGSDVGAIMRVDPAFGSQNFMRVLNGKLGKPAPEDEALDALRDDLRSAIGRGNAWEEYIRYRVLDLHPHKNVAYCKSSWHGKGDLHYRHANFDGLFLDDNGVPEGVLEIKTGSKASKWGAVSEGFSGVPEGYRKQILWYAAVAGLKYGKIVALLSDHDYREYDFSMSDPAIVKELEVIFGATDIFWNSLAARRAEVLTETVKPFRKYNSLTANESIDSIADVLAGYTGDSKAIAKRSLIAAIAQAQGPRRRELSRKEFQALVFSVFAQHDPTKRVRPLIGIDIETNTTSARTGRIIETGIVKLSPTGEFEIIYNELHGLPELAKIGVGVGAVNVHHITEERLTDKRLFEDEAELILSLLLDSTLVAHNAGFEDRFLSANLPGYVEAKAEGRITLLDTRKVAKYLMPRSMDNTLNSFAEGNGIPYSGAHAAAQDALMMMKALRRLQTSVHANGRFITQRPSALARLAAEKDALNR